MIFETASQNACLIQHNALYAWGDNIYSQIGDPTFPSYSLPDHIGSSSWKQISSGDYHSLGIKIDGTLWGGALIIMDS
jgi:alpha-tubulin suppressor-like RCC1 family protein